jgi:steroid 5-alpha reductase family enzyme
MRLQPAQVGALASIALSALAGLVFFLITLATGNYTWVARIGGSAWVFALSSVILLPTLMPWLRDRAGR